MKLSSYFYKAGISLMKASRTARIAENVGNPAKLGRILVHRYVWRNVIKGASKLIGK